LFTELFTGKREKAKRRKVARGQRNKISKVCAHAWGGKIVRLVRIYGKSKRGEG